ncbi:mCG146164, partial [Mus musculus]
SALTSTTIKNAHLTVYLSLQLMTQEMELNLVLTLEHSCTPSTLLFATQIPRRSCFGSHYGSQDGLFCHHLLCTDLQVCSITTGFALRGWEPDQYQHA